MKPNYIYVSVMQENDLPNSFMEINGYLNNKFADMLYKDTEKEEVEAVFSKTLLDIAQHFVHRGIIDYRYQDDFTSFLRSVAKIGWSGRSCI